MLSWQADDVLPQWTLNYIGAIKIHIQRTQFILGMFNTIMIGVTAYYNSPIPAVELWGIKPWTTVYGWLATVCLGATLFLVVDRTTLYPAEVSYNSHQASREDRNPGYRLTVKNSEKLDRIERKLDITQTDGEHENDDD